MLHVHKWSKWTDVPVVWSSPLFRIPPRREDGQERRCTRCKRRELRLV